MLWAAATVCFFGFFKERVHWENGCSLCPLNGCLQYNMTTRGTKLGPLKYLGNPSPNQPSPPGSPSPTFSARQLCWIQLLDWNYKISSPGRR